MHLLFVDESGTPPKPDNPDQCYFVIAGLVIPEDRWSGMRDKLVGLKRSHAYRGELKWRFFAPNNRDNKNPMLNWSQDAKNTFRDKVFKIITDAKSCRIVACSSESLTAYALGNVNSQSDLYFRTYKPVTERFQYLLQDITRTSGTDTMGMIVADHRERAMTITCASNTRDWCEIQVPIPQTTLISLRAFSSHPRILVLEFNLSTW